MKLPKGCMRSPPACMKTDMRAAAPYPDHRKEGGSDAGIGRAIGEFRACSLLETFQKVKPHLARLGITRVASQTGLDRLGIPVWCAFVPNAKAIVIAQGKGLDEEAARVSAVMEAVERVVATEPGCSKQVSTAADHVCGGQRVHTLNGLIARHQAPLRHDEPVAWVDADDLSTGGRISLPFDALDFDRTRLSPRYWQSSDGLASGNTRDEAILHGLLERVERDALALWSVSRREFRFTRRIDPQHLKSAALIELLSTIRMAGLQLALFDITTDLGIPCVAALLAPDDQSHTIRYAELTLGAGAALEPEAAIIRAVLETVQSRMTYIAGARDDLLPSVFDKPADPTHLAAFLSPAAHRVDDMPVFSAESTRSALDMIVSQLATSQITELFAVELGYDWLPVSVVKVFAPQLENPDGARRLRFGPRALSRSLQ